MATPRKRIGDLMVESGIITQEQLEQALAEQKATKTKLGDVLINKGFVTQQQFIEVLEFQLGIPHVQLYRQKIDPKIIALLSKNLADEYCVIPLRVEGNKLIVAMADPLDYYAIDVIRIATGFRVEPVIASRNELERAINRYYSLSDSIEQISQNLQLQELDEEEASDENSPVVRTVNQIIHQAVQLEASDIHFDPQEGGYRIRYRIDGVMRTEQTLPANMHGVIAARIKVMSNLNVAERRLPQDGRIELEVDFRKVDLRIATLPTVYGEKIVIRILDLGNSLTHISQLGLSPWNEHIFMNNIDKSNGVVLITGPTGSGKSTTLYSALSHLNKEDVNIVTVEDPVEYQLDGINQMQVNTTTGLTFARGLRSILRLDPNIIMIGEIRDTETAEIAIRAAMTGHLVFSTLHTNSAVNTINRLSDMGVEPFLLSSSLNCIVAQRLVRRVCTQCKTRYTPSEKEVILLQKYGLETDVLYHGSGCAECNRTGYRGRLAVHEVLPIDNTLRSMIMKQRGDHEYLEYAVSQGMITLLEDGFRKAFNGLTTISEVIRVIGLQEE